MKKHLQHTIKLIIVGVLSLATTTTASAQSTLIKDLNTQHTTAGSNPQNFATVNGITYFRASTQIFDDELWRTDGTDKGTYMVANINNDGPSSPVFVGSLGNIAFFKCFTEESGVELWRTDGTREGTSLVIDLRPGPEGSYPTVVGVLNGELYLNATTDESGAELWKTDGTAAGTKLFADTDTGAGSGSPGEFVMYRGWAYFLVTDGGLWKTDGTTVEKTDLTFYRPKKPVVYNDRLYLPTGTNLFRSDGTQDGTEFIYQFSELGDISVLNGKMYFSAEGLGLGDEPWVSDGTDVGTINLANISQLSGYGSNPGDFMTLGDLVIFRAYDGTKSEIWKTDGTPGGTKEIKKDAVGIGWYNLVAGDDEVFFNVTFDGYDGQLWRSDGTDEGTQPVYNTIFRAPPAYAFYIGQGKLLFTAGTEETGRELWITDGTSANTKEVKDINRAPESGYPSRLTKVGSWVYFAADDGVNGRELWKTDGTPQGTTMVSPLANTDARNPYFLVEMNGSLYFSGDELTSGRELWKSDGTLEGTLAISDGPGSLGPQYLFNFDGTLLFGGTNATGIELWKSDGTKEGTALLKEINPGQLSSSPADFIKLNNSIVLFTAYKSGNGAELWKTDKTTEGTEMIKDIVPGNGSSSPRNMFLHNNHIYFIAEVEDLGATLWKTNGTEEGTVMVKDISEGSTSLIIRNFTSSGNLLFFVTNDGVHGSELWKTDGTEGGTVMVKDIVPGAETSNPISLVEYDGKVLFTAYDNNGNFLLFESDGSEIGTFALKKIGTRAEGYEASNFVRIRNTLFFKAGIRGSDKYELWKTNATFCSTFMVGDDASFEINEAIWLGDKYIVTTSNHEAGEELFSFTGPMVPGCFQTLVFDPIAPKTIVDDPFQLVASTSSGLAVYFNSSNTNVAAIEGKTVTIKGVGTTIIVAKQQGDDYHRPATPIERELIVAPITGLENSPEHFIYYYPNPAHDVITVGSDYNEKQISVEVIDVLGNRLTSSQSLQVHTNGQSAELNISSLKAGVYYLRFVVGENAITKAIVKN